MTHMPEHWGFIALIWGLGIAGVLKTGFWRGDRDARRRRRLDRPSTSIADARPGSVIKIVGRAEAVEGLVEAPLSGRSAIAFVTRVHIHSSTREADGVHLYRDEKRAQDFLVRDATGVALVRAAHADVVAGSYDFGIRDGREERWLRTRGGHSRFLGIAKRHLQFSEAALIPGGEVVVLGRCAIRSEAGTDGPYRDSGAPTITIEAPAGGKVLLSWGTTPNPTQPLFTP